MVMIWNRIRNLNAVVLFFYTLIRIVCDRLRNQAIEYAIGFRWDQVSNMAVVGLFFWILIQNDGAASTFAQTIIETMQTTLKGYLTGSY